MKVIAIVDTEDCGPFVVTDPEAISIIKCSDFYIAATQCLYTARPLTAEISEEIVNQLIQKGVKCYDWLEPSPNLNNSKEKPKKKLD